MDHSSVGCETLREQTTQTHHANRGRREPKTSQTAVGENNKPRQPWFNIAVCENPPVCGGEHARRRSSSLNPDSHPLKKNTVGSGILDTKQPSLTVLGTLMMRLIGQFKDCHWTLKQLPPLPDNRVNASAAKGTCFDLIGKLLNCPFEGPLSTQLSVILVLIEKVRRTNCV